MIADTLKDLLLSLGFRPGWLPLSTSLVLAVASLALALLLYMLGALILNKLVHRIIKASKATWDDVLLERRVFHRLLKVVPWAVIFLSLPLVFGDYPSLAETLRRIVRSLIGAQLLVSVNALLDAANVLYEKAPGSRQRPVKGYVQLVKIFIYIVAFILVGTAILNISPVAILSGFGAMSAVLMLVFKDSIMGLVSSFQLSGNDMVRLGDWIEMPRYGADGDVIDISLHTVKVRNWDMTITTIPIYALISDSFKNWRGMSESGGRRIMRQLNIDAEAVRFLDDAELKAFRGLELLKEYMERKEAELAAWNSERGYSQADGLSGRRLTNIGTFRAYMQAYLRQHPEINQSMICMVRQLASGPQGIPLEVYAFVRDKVWVNYEAIQADIFDHFLAVLPRFGLRLFQQPSGWDLRNVGARVPYDGVSGSGSGD